AVHDETEGNPLFLGEVVRLLLDEGRLEGADAEVGNRLAVPRGVKEVIKRRLNPLPDSCRGPLTLASVLGREFSLEALVRLTGQSVDDILELLEEALLASVITDVPGSKGHLRF